MNNKNFSLNAVFFGIAIQIVGSIAISIIISAISRTVLTGRGYEEAEIKQFFISQFNSVPFMIAGIMPNFLMAAAAGYIVAKSANKLEYWHALISISIVALVYYGPAIGKAPGWFSALSISGLMFSALSGAGIYKIKKQAKDR
ncbi:MAG TPA: hypothetical protein VIM85_01920 [Pseudomonadales bacterium]